MLRRTTQTIDAALNGRLGVHGLAELVHHPLSYGLADLLRECLPGREDQTRLELLRTKYKPDRKLTAYYRLSVGAEVRPIALSWFTESAPAVPNGADLGDEAEHRHLLAPFAHLTARTAGDRAVLRVAPFDPDLPQLTRLNDHAYVTGLLAELSSSPTSRPAVTSIQAVRYRPGQRHVLHVSLSSDQADAATFIKIDRDDCGGRAVSFAETVGPRLAEHCATVRLVSPLGYSVPDRAALWQGVPGQSMTETLRDPARGAELLGRLGCAIRALHDLAWPATPQDSRTAPWPVHLAPSEVAATLRAGEHLTALSPQLGAHYRQLAAEVLERLADLPEGTPRLSHGDLKCDNIVAAGERIWLLDLDRAGRAEPALDVAKLLADLAWWSDHHAVDVAPLVHGFFAGYGRCDPARLARARLIAVLFRLKLAARRVPVHAPDWEARTTRHVAAAAASLRQEIAA